METSLEHLLMNSYKAGMIAYMNVYPQDFEEAIQLAVSDKQPYSWRAAWLLWSCMEKNDQRIRGHIREIIDTLTTKNDDHQRELLKILLQMELNKEYEGFLYNVCVAIWEKVKKKPSVRFTALRMVLKIAKKHPGLAREITLLTRDHYLESMSEAARKSVARMIEGFNRSQAD